MKITKQISPDLLFEELESIGSTYTVVVDGVLERHSKTALTKVEDGYILDNAPAGAELIVLAHDPLKKSKKEEDKEVKNKNKKSKRDKVLKKLGITEQELLELLE
jgi:hypothetical protein